MGYSKHELSTINMFSTPPKNCYITPLTSHSGNLSPTGAFFCPQSGLCEEVRLYLFRERLSQKLCTRQSRKGIMGYDQYTVPSNVDVEPTFVAFL